MPTSSKLAQDRRPSRVETAQRLRPPWPAARIAPADRARHRSSSTGARSARTGARRSPAPWYSPIRPTATDSYDRDGGNLSWRLKGWAKTDADGRFEFSTIRPGHYPGEQIAAHVHFVLMPDDGNRYHGGELLFEGDPALTARQKAASAGAGMFAEIRPVRRDGATEHVELNVKVNPAEKF